MTKPKTKSTQKPHARRAAPVLDDTPRFVAPAPKNTGPNQAATADRMATVRHTVPGPLPTKAQAFLTLCECARRFADRQTDTTFNQLADAVAIARLLKLY